MDAIGAFILPGLLVLIVVVVTYVTVYWVYDGSDDDELDPNQRRRYRSGNRKSRFRRKAKSEH